MGRIWDSKKKSKGHLELAGFDGRDWDIPETLPAVSPRRELCNDPKLTPPVLPLILLPPASSGTSSTEYSLSLLRLRSLLLYSGLQRSSISTGRVSEKHGVCH